MAKFNHYHLLADKKKSCNVPIHLILIERWKIFHNGKGTGLAGFQDVGNQCKTQLL